MKLALNILALYAFTAFAWSSYDKTHPSESDFVAQQLLEYNMTMLYGQPEPTTPLIHFARGK